MSRKLAAVAAAFAFTALVGAAPDALAQAQSDMVPPGAAPNRITPGAMQPTRNPGTMSAYGAPAEAGMARGQARQSRSARSERRAMRGERRGASGSDAAYMGGGGVYERAPDGSLRPVM